MTTAGYRGDRSPDRADAMVWGLAAVFPALARQERADKRALAKPKVLLGYSASKGRR
jgi:phage terminase large subunit-like protein